MKSSSKKKEPVTSRYNITAANPKDHLSCHWLNYSYPTYHKHDFWEILLITNGVTNNYINNQTHILKSGDMVLLRPHDAHYILNHENSNCKHLSFSITKNYLLQYCKLLSEDKNIYDELLNSTSPIFYSLKNEILQKIFFKILPIFSTNIHAHDKNFKLKLIAHQLLHCFIEEKFEKKNKLPKWFLDFLSKLNDPFIKISNVNELALSTNYSYSRLSVIFKEYTGSSIIEYSTAIKMNYAKEILECTNISIIDLALDLKYESLSHFIRTFKKTYGFPPNQYRKNHINQHNLM